MGIIIKSWHYIWTYYGYNFNIKLVYYRMHDLRGFGMNRHNTTEADTGIVDHDHKRDIQRKSVLWQAYINIDGQKFYCQVRNLSVGGLKIKLDFPFENGVTCTVEIPRYNLNLNAEIAWHSDEFFGLKFLDDHELIREQFSEGAAVVGVDAARFMEALG